MTNPDLPEPVDLTLHPITESELVDAAATAFKLRVPEWNPQEGSTEVMLMETLAVVLGQFVFALNQLPRVTLDGLIALRGFERKQPVAAVGQIQLQISSSSLGTRTLPAGARFRVQTQDGLSIEALVAETYQLNPSDSLNAVVNVVAGTAGALGNAVPSGTPAVMIDPYTWIETAVVYTAFTTGGDAEDDATFYGRVAAAFQSQTQTLVTERQFATMALQHPNIGRARAFGRWDGVGQNGSVQGHVTVAVAGPDGADVTSDVKAEVAADLLSHAVAGLAVHVMDFQRVAMNLAVTYTLMPGYTAATVGPQIVAALKAWLNPLSWPFEETLTSVNQIILRIGRVSGVDNVTAVTGWQAVTGGASLPQVGTVTTTAA